MTEGLVELSSCLWSSTAAAPDATLTRSLVLLTRSLAPDSGKQPSTPRFAPQIHVVTMVGDGDTNPISKTTKPGEITSPNYPESNYPNNLEKTETIQVTRGMVLRLEFTDFAVEWEPTCQYDYVRITDGDGTILMNNSCGFSSVDPSEPHYFLPPVMNSRTNSMSVFLRTNNIRTDPGWRLSWTEVVPGRIFLHNFCNFCSKDEKSVSWNAGDSLCK